MSVAAKGISFCELQLGSSDAKSGWIDVRFKKKNLTINLKTEMGLLLLNSRLIWEFLLKMF